MLKARKSVFWALAVFVAAVAIVGMQWHRKVAREGAVAVAETAARAKSDRLVRQRSDFEVTIAEADSDIVEVLRQIGSSEIAFVTANDRARQSVRRVLSVALSHPELGPSRLQGAHELEGSLAMLTDCRRVRVQLYVRAFEVCTERAQALHTAAFNDLFPAKKSDASANTTNPL
jgi:hypothetical protein